MLARAGPSADDRPARQAARSAENNPSADDVTPLVSRRMHDLSAHTEQIRLGAGPGLEVFIIVHWRLTGSLRSTRSAHRHFGVGTMSQLPVLLVFEGFLSETEPVRCSSSRFQSRK
jgi:hypothetical protein